MKVISAAARPRVRREGPLEELAAALRADDPAVLGDDLAAKRRHDRSTSDRHALEERGVGAVAHDLPGEISHAGSRPKPLHQFVAPDSASLNVEAMPSKGTPKHRTFGQPQYEKSESVAVSYRTLSWRRMTSRMMNARYFSANSGSKCADSAR